MRARSSGAREMVTGRGAILRADGECARTCVSEGVGAGRLSGSSSVRRCAPRRLPASRSRPGSSRMRARSSGARELVTGRGAIVRADSERARVCARKSVRGRVVCPHPGPGPVRRECARVRRVRGNWCLVGARLCARMAKARVCVRKSVRGRVVCPHPGPGPVRRECARVRRVRGNWCLVGARLCARMAKARVCVRKSVRGRVVSPPAEVRPGSWRARAFVGCSWMRSGA
jgi:hypothetical protein